VCQDAALELLELLARLDAQLVDERPARILVRLEGLGLAPRAVEREHQLGAQPLSKRMVADQRFELADHLRVVAERQLGLDALLDGRQAQLLEAGDLALGEGLIREIGERGTTPEREGVSQQLGGALRATAGKGLRALVQQPLEACPVELVGPEPDQVPAPAREDHAVRARPTSALERLAQARDVHLEALGGAGRRVLTPELVDQPVARDDLVRVQQQDRQHRALLAAGERELTALVNDL
jgi:hypothetical protein